MRAAQSSGNPIQQGLRISCGKQQDTVEERREADESLLSAGMTSTSLRLCLLPCAAGVMIILWIKKTDDSGVGVEAQITSLPRYLLNAVLQHHRNFEELCGRHALTNLPPHLSGSSLLSLSSKSTLAACL